MSTTLVIMICMVTVKQCKDSIEVLLTSRTDLEQCILGMTLIPETEFTDQNHILTKNKRIS